MEKKVVAIDIGGTKIKYGLIKETGEILHKGVLSTEHWLGADILWQKILNIISTYNIDHKVDGIGISTAGVVDNDSGTVLYASEHLPGWTGKAVKEELYKIFAVQVEVENDVNCAVYGEAWNGAGKDLKNFICITYGTGIGAGIIIDGKLYRGAHKCAGEVSYLHQDRKKNLLCYTNEASVKQLVYLGKEVALSQGMESDAAAAVDGYYIINAVREGKKEYINLLNDWIAQVAKGISDIYYILDPEAIIIGGGISESSDILLPLLKAEMKKYILPPFAVELRSAVLGNDAGIIGAARLVLKS